MIDDWVMLKNNKIINMIRWDGDADTWPIPAETILVKRNDFDFSTVIPDEEEILTDI